MEVKNVNKDSYNGTCIDQVNVILKKGADTFTIKTSMDKNRKKTYCMYEY